jgi:DNA-binding response OmpR family regulator
MIRNILVIEDEEDMRQYLKEILLTNGYSVKTISTGVAGLTLLSRYEPDLVILDLGLPDIRGESVCQEIRKLYPKLPVVILTAQGSTQKLVEGLNSGANDFIAKPFETSELLARIRARLRESGQIQSKFKAGDLELDANTMEVKRAKKLIKLTPQEFRLLQYLISNKNQVLSRDMILNRIWPYSSDIETRVVDVYIGYLRKKIDNGSRQKLIQSVRGFGYIIKD